MVALLRRHQRRRCGDDPRGGRYLVAIGLAFCASPAAAQPAEALYSIAQVRFEIDEEAYVGRWKAGLICLPNGTLRWRDIATPPATTALRDAAVALAAAGQSVAVPPDEIFQDRQPVTPYRIVATVTAARLDICMPKWGAPQFGFGDKGVLKGKGALTIRWTIHSAATRSLIQSVEIAEPFDILPTGRGGVADAIRVGLSANAARFGRSHTLAIDGEPGR